VIHLRAKRLLSSLPDGLLEPATEHRVRTHAAGCARCRAELRSLEASAGLLRRLPRSLVPLRADAEAEARLEALARWGRMPAARVIAPRRSPVATLGRLAPLAATVALALLLGGSRPEAPEAMDGNEAFNFVLAGSLVPAPPAGGPIVRARALAEDGGQVTRAWIHPPSATFLPPGAR